MLYGEVCEMGQGGGGGGGTSEDGMQCQEIGPDGRADHGEGEEEEFEDYGAGEVVSDSAWG